MSDLISKQAVLEAIAELNAISFYEAQEDSKETYYEIKNIIKKLPLVRPQEQTGHWIVNTEEVSCECSECHIKWYWPLSGYNYCPNCGAEMESEE